MVMRRIWALLAGGALLFAPAPGLPSGMGHGKPEVRGDTRGKHRGTRPTGGRRRPAAGQRLPQIPGVWWAPAELAAPDPGPSVVIIQQTPRAVQVDPPAPPPSEPAYYWYYCGPAGTRPSPWAAAGYCIGGLTPRLRGLPGPGKTLEQFEADDAACQDWASAHAATIPGASNSMQGRYDLAYQQCLHAKGNQVPGEVGPRLAEDRPSPFPSRR